MQEVFTCHQLPAAQYHAHPGVSQGNLKHMQRSPAHYIEAVRNPPATTPAMVLGSVLHHALLTPDLIPTWVVKPEGLSLATKEGKEWRKAQGVNQIIAAADWASVSGMIDAVRNHPVASRAISGGQPEMSVINHYHDPAHGPIMRKARIDYVSGASALVDVKTTQDARPEPFARSAWDLGYHIQAAYYLDAWNQSNPDDEKQMFVFVAVEKEPPHGVGVHVIGPDEIELGRRTYKRLLAMVAECKAADSWPCYSDEISTLNFPEWIRQKEGM